MIHKRRPSKEEREESDLQKRLTSLQENVKKVFLEKSKEEELEASKRGLERAHDQVERLQQILDGWADDISEGLQGEEPKDWTKSPDVIHTEEMETVSKSPRSSPPSETEPHPSETETVDANFRGIGIQTADTVADFLDALSLRQKRDALALGNLIQREYFGDDKTREVTKGDKAEKQAWVKTVSTALQRTGLRIVAEKDGTVHYCTPLLSDKTIQLSGQKNQKPGWPAEIVLAVAPTRFKK